MIQQIYHNNYLKLIIRNTLTPTILKYISTTNRKNNRINIQKIIIKGDFVALMERKFWYDLAPTFDIFFSFNFVDSDLSIQN